MSNNPLVWTDDWCAELTDFAALLEASTSSSTT